VADALLDGLRQNGVGLLAWHRDARALRERLAFCHHAFGPPWPAVDDASLLERAGEGLDLSTARRRPGAHRRHQRPAPIAALAAGGPAGRVGAETAAQGLDECIAGERSDSCGDIRGSAPPLLSPAAGHGCLHTYERRTDLPMCVNIG
jgi:hypothetical protein